MYVVGLGNDENEEPMYETLNRLGQHSVIVSSDLNQKTAALEKLNNPQEALKFLQTLAKLSEDE